MENKDLPAFPDPRRGAGQTFTNQTPEKEPAGLTKREYFAAMAMQGLLANIIYHNPDRKHQMVTVGALAECATHYADALLSELSKPQP